MNLKSLSVIFLILVIALAGCRTPRRGIPTDAETVSVNIALFGLDESDVGKDEWVYELSICVDAVNGTLQDDNAVTFSTTGITEGMNCQLSVKIINPDPGIGISFQGEDNVMYWARDVVIASDSFGELSARASLQRLYSIGETDVEVVTEAADCTGENKIYNPETRLCEDKP